MPFNLYRNVDLTFLYNFHVHLTSDISEIRGKGFQRRGSFFDVMRPNRGNENQAIDLANIETLESTPTSPTNTLGNTLPVPQKHDRKTSRNRSDSIITPGLIKNLKKNKKRIIAKG